jgi:cobalamin biosynthetic protein CobC
VNAVAVTFERLAQHGGRIAEARAHFPHAPRPWIDLSTGINRRSYRAPHASTQQRRALPQPEQLQQLEAVAAKFFGVDDAQRVVAVAGTELAIRLLPAVLGIRKAAVRGPTYSSHADGWRWLGAEVEVFTELAALTMGDAAMAITVVNPNNPDGRVTPPEQLLDLHDRLGCGDALIVDEAFADVDPTLSIATLAGTSRAPRLIVLRSFGKFFGLAGLRLGFVIATTPIAARLRALLGDWPVSVDAIVAGCAAYADTVWIERTRDWLQRQSQRLDTLLERLGYEVIGGTSLYRLTRTSDAPNRFQTLLRAGILVRPFDHEATLLRFGIPYGRNEWLRLAASTPLSKP